MEHGGATMTTLQDIKYLIAIPVWGRTHVNIFLNVFVPSMLAANNIRYLTRVAYVKCILYVRYDELEQIKLHPSIIKLSQLLTVEYQNILFVQGRSNHNILSDCHKLGLEQASATDSYIIMPPPDSVWSNNSLRALHALVLQGKKAVHMACLRLQLEFAYAELTELTNEHGVIDFSANDLVKFTMPRMHTICKSHFYNYYSGCINPANILWHVEGGGILANCFHLHPILIKPNLNSLNFASTIDDDLLLGDTFAADEVYIVQNSDEMLAYEISPQLHVLDSVSSKNNLDEMVAWAMVKANSVHRVLVQTPIFLHYDDLTSKFWTDIELQAKDLTQQLLTKIKAADKLQQSVGVDLKRKITLIYSNIIYYTARFNNFYLGSNAKRRKTHWMFLTETKIYKPIADQIIKLPGTTCFIDDNQRTLLPFLHAKFDVFKCYYTSKQEILAHSDEMLSAHKFDNIVYRVQRNDEQIQDLLDTAQGLLAHGGRVILYGFADVVQKLCVGNYRLECVDIGNLGGWGARLGLHLNSSNTPAAYVSFKSKVRYTITGIIAKSFIRVAVLLGRSALYPLFSGFMHLLELVSSRTATQNSK